jgi:hypothetical protein
MTTKTKQPKHGTERTERLPDGRYAAQYYNSATEAWVTLSISGTVAQAQAQIIESHTLD